ncbi:NAC transcription factor 29-like [Solanum dulcamara]|uniref:NAC transcription factor 29-like n=1 Tax=Solanum dulcamara TaxID=45834 RepID=UPI0024850497|nr:NAC transcription factor 29-like [Solanum dulcamara]
MGRPMGYRFHPTNTEVLQYLLGFARDEPLPDQNELMHEVDLYADKEPWQIFEGTNSNSNTRYFITPQKKHNPEWKRFSRSVGKGTWKAQGKGKEVFDKKGRVIGYMKSLKYNYGKEDNKNANGEWLMTEYSLYDGYLEPRQIKKKGYVICKIKKKGSKSIIDDGVADVINMNDIDEYINSVLQEDDQLLAFMDKNNNVEEDIDVGDEVLALMGNDDAEEDDNAECLEGHPSANIDLEDIDFVL